MMDKTGSALPRTATHCHALPRTATHLFACLECLAWLAILSGLISDPFPPICIQPEVPPPAVLEAQFGDAHLWIPSFLLAVSLFKDVQSIQLQVKCSSAVTWHSWDFLGGFPLAVCLAGVWRVQEWLKIGGRSDNPWIKSKKDKRFMTHQSLVGSWLIHLQASISSSEEVSKLSCFFVPRVHPLSSSKMCKQQRDNLCGPKLRRLGLPGRPLVPCNGVIADMGLYNLGHHDTTSKITWCSPANT